MVVEVQKVFLLAAFLTLACVHAAAWAQEGAGGPLQFVMPQGMGGNSHFGVPGPEPYAQPSGQTVAPYPNNFMTIGHSCMTPAGKCRDEKGGKVGGGCYCLDDNNAIVFGVRVQP